MDKAAPDIPHRLPTLGIEDEVGSLRISLEVVWLFHGTMLVFLMQVGFAMLESGAVRAKNRKTVLLKNMVDIPVTAIAWWIMGHWIATGIWRVDFEENPQLGLNLLFSYGFANCATTILSGAVTERITLVAYGTMVFATAAFLYPAVAFAVWHTDGILNSWGFVDFAGSAVVHVIGGTVAGVASRALGPRRYAVPERIANPEVWGQQHDRARSAVAELGLNFTGKFDFQAYVRYLQTLEDKITNVEGGVFGMVAGGRVYFRKFERPDLEGQEFRPNSRTHVVLGTMLIWLGWYGFNACTTSLLGGYSVGRICSNTLMAACGGVACAVVSSTRLHFFPRFRVTLDGQRLLNLICNDTLSALAAACAAANTMSSPMAFVVGFVGATCHSCLSLCMERAHVDDPLDACAVHMGGGMAGTILGPVLCFEGPFGGHCQTERHLHVQVAGVVLIAGFAAAVTAVLCEVLSRLGRLRWPQEWEDEGMDAWMKESEAVAPSADLMSALPSMVPKQSNLAAADLDMLRSKNAEKERRSGAKKISDAPRVVCLTRVHAGTNHDLDYVYGCHADLVQALGCKAVGIQRTIKVPRALSLYLPMDGLLVSGTTTASDTPKASIVPWKSSSTSDQAAAAAKLLQTTTRSSHEEIELALLKYALMRGLPVLAVNRGCCLVNQLLSGRDGPHRHGGLEVHCLDELHPDYGSFKHAVNVVPGSPMDDWYSRDLDGDELLVNSYHERCIDQLADGLLPMAKAPDGSVEAYYRPDHDPEQGRFLVGLQFNPERMLPDLAGNLEVYRAFLRACQAVKNGRSSASLVRDPRPPGVEGRGPPDPHAGRAPLPTEQPLSESGSDEPGWPFGTSQAAMGGRTHWEFQGPKFAQDRDASFATPTSPDVVAPSPVDTVVGKRFQANFEALPPGTTLSSCSTGSFASSCSTV